MEEKEQRKKEEKESQRNGVKRTEKKRKTAKEYDEGLEKQVEQNSDYIFDFASCPLK